MVVKCLATETFVHGRLCQFALQEVAPEFIPARKWLGTAALELWCIGACVSLGFLQVADKASLIDEGWTGSPVAFESLSSVLLRYVFPGPRLAVS